MVKQIHSNTRTDCLGQIQTDNNKFDTISDSTLIPFRGMIQGDKLSECEKYLKELESILQ